MTAPRPSVSKILSAATATLLVLLAAAGPLRAQDAGQPPRGFLGIGLEPVSGPVRAALALEEGAGVMVGSVVEPSAAEEAGLQEGDIIVAIDGRPVRGPRELMATIGEHAPGDNLQLEVWRQGQRHRTEAFLGERPDRDRKPAGGRNTRGGEQLLGITPLALTDQLADYFVAPFGVLVARVAEGSPGEVAGLLAGDVVVAVDDREVRSPGELHRAIAGAESPTVLMAVVRNGSDIYLEVARL